MKTVLIVDDEDDALKHLAHAVERCGLHVITAQSGKDAVQQYRDNAPDLVLLDLVLPDFRGDEALRQILLINKDARVYFVTGYDELLTEEKALRLGARGLFTKPLMMEQLRNGQFLSKEV
jgi:CheY-like chemotaxis protein